MGWKSTVDLTREEAVKIILETNWDDVADRELANIIEEIFGGIDHGNNYCIVPSPCKNPGKPQ